MVHMDHVVLVVPAGRIGGFDAAAAKTAAAAHLFAAEIKMFTQPNADDVLNSCCSYRCCCCCCCFLMFASACPSTTLSCLWQLLLKVLLSSVSARLEFYLTLGVRHSHASYVHNIYVRVTGVSLVLI